MNSRSLLTLQSQTAAEINAVANRAIELARDFEERKPAQSLKGKRIGLIVEERGWRNTTALDLGMQVLGAHCTQITASLSGAESLEDLARYFENWFDLIAVRCPSLERMTALAAATRLPVLNLRTRQNHPCETLGDLCYIKQQRGSLENLTVAAVAPAGNILHSWAEAAEVLPLTLIQVYPQSHWIDRAAYPAPGIETTEDLSPARGADVLVTDCWPEDTSGLALEELRITADFLDGVQQDCLFIPCPPVTRGAEVSADAMAHVKCRSYEAKAFLMHAQNAVIERALLP